ncbi:hypothetical protein SUDANB108_00175 [Streptomyces sp. enrichment culture]|uniref:hypothetical protein n=1 Tax=Streptomyces sp. enrichment culture TaxID=1795815 RepID=UPI003F5640E1
MPSQSTPTLRSRLVEQAASDLEENRRRQRELTERLAVLQQEEALLQDILELAQRYERFGDPSRLPEQLQNGSDTRQAKRASAGGGTRRPSGSSSAPGGAGAGRRSARPLLGDLLLELLGEHDEPRLAAELRDELMERHPDREPTPQVVRNTLESLVAKGRVKRHKQRRSVLYTVVREATA